MYLALFWKYYFENIKYTERRLYTHYVTFAILEVSLIFISTINNVYCTLKKIILKYTDNFNN